MERNNQLGNESMFNWNPNYHTAEENSRWVWLRAEEWESYPTFLSPLWGILIVYFYGWLLFLITLVIITFIWKLFIVKNFISVTLLSTMAIMVNILKWPIAVIMAFVAYLTHRVLLFDLALLFFPLLTYFLVFLELPYRVGGITRQSNRKRQIQERIEHKLRIHETAT